jgi:hypothetical protein
MARYLFRSATDQSGLGASHGLSRIFLMVETMFIYPVPKNPSILPSTLIAL